jgi:hypothetical protein
MSDLYESNHDVDWTKFDVPTIWERMQYEDDYFTRMQVSAWKRTSELLDSFRLRLEALTVDLERAWPPHPDTAAGDYSTNLAGLHASVSGTSMDTATNAVALNNMTDTLMEARLKVARLNRQWQSADKNTQRDLNKQVAAVMDTADRTAYDYATGLTKSNEYRIAGGKDTWTPLPPDGGGGGVQGHQNHTIDPTAAAGSTSSQTAPDPALAGAPPGNEPSLSGQPGLAGAGTGTPQHNDAASASPAASFVTAAFERTRAGAEPRSGMGWTDRTAVQSGSTRPDQLRAGSPSHAGEAGAPGERSQSAATPGVLGAPGNRAPRRRRTGPAYTEWYVRAGVAPILQPSPEATDHDPGSGVWGIDR